MSSTYWFYFTPNPADSANLSPTFLNFVRADGSTLAPPGITQIAVNTGIYSFVQSTTVGIFFRIDGATTGGGLSPVTRYLAGAIDPVDQIDASLPGAIGTTSSSFGTTGVDPDTVFGYLKRIRELLEGGQSFSKTSAQWLMYSRGFTTLLAAKTVTNDANGVTRS